MKETILLVFIWILLTDGFFTLLIYGSKGAKIVAMIGLLAIATWIVFHGLKYWT